MPLRLFLVAPSALLTDHRPHGDGLVAFGFARALAARGHELHVAAGRVAVHGALPANLHLHPFSGRGGAARSRLGFLAHVRRLHRRLEAAAPFDVVHQLTPVDVGATLSLGPAPAPLVLGPYVPNWVPSEDVATRQSAVGAWIRRGVRTLQQRRATTVLLSSPAAAEKLAARPRRGLLVRELPLGVDDQAWRPAANGRRPGRDVLFLASLDRRKGIHVALDAFERLAGSFPDARLLVAGGGDERASIAARVTGSALSDRVRLLGPLDREATVAAMQSCDVYCLPSLGEPFGLTALEAMACAKPVVATRSGGLGHLVPEDGGRKVAPGDPAGLAGALGELLADPKLRLRMGAHNRRLVEQRYAWGRVTEQLEEIYAEAMGAGRPR